jgi:hypothetical protein
MMWVFEVEKNILEQIPPESHVQKAANALVD